MRWTCIWRFEEALVFTTVILRWVWGHSSKMVKGRNVISELWGMYSAVTFGGWAIRLGESPRSSTVGKFLCIRRCPTPQRTLFSGHPSSVPSDSSPRAVRLLFQRKENGSKSLRSLRNIEVFKKQKTEIVQGCDCHPWGLASWWWPDVLGRRWEEWAQLCICRAWLLSQGAGKIPSTVVCPAIQHLLENGAKLDTVFFSPLFFSLPK